MTQSTDAGAAGADARSPDKGDREGHGHHHDAAIDAIGEQAHGESRQGAAAQGVQVNTQRPRSVPAVPLPENRQR